MMRGIFFVLFIIFLGFNSVLFSQEKSLPMVLKSVTPSVVSVYAVNYKDENNIKVFLQSSMPDGSTGSGVIFDQSGLFITNNHVIVDKPYVKVVLQDGRVFPAKLIRQDPSLDLAILKIDTEKVIFPAIKIGKSQKLAVGETVLAIGNPFGIGVSVSSGIISALPNKNNIGIGHLIQTDAVLNPGNSGGALINTLGELIGINTFIFSKTGTFSGIGFAIPADTIKLFIDRTISGKKIKQYWLGLSAVDVNNEIANKVGLSLPQGVFVTQVYVGASAEKAGVKVGDIILKLDDEEVNSLSQLSFMVASLDNNKPKKLQIYRDNRVIVIDIIPEIPQENNLKDQLVIDYGFFQGYTFVNNSYAIAYDLGVNPAESGVIVYAVSENSFLKTKLPIAFAIIKGDMILSINNQNFSSTKELKDFLEENKNLKTYDIVLKRGGNIIEFRISY
jgi:S1-C subfamily serine protease